MVGHVHAALAQRICYRIYSFKSGNYFCPAICLEETYTPAIEKVTGFVKWLGDWQTALIEKEN